MPVRVAAAVSTALLLCACASTPQDDALIEGIRDEVRALSTPEGWERTTEVEFSCVTINLDCDDSRATTTFTHDGPRPEACASFVAWTFGFDSAVAIDSDLVESAPSQLTCDTAIRTTGAYIVTAVDQVVSQPTSWRMVLIEVDGGVRLDVVLDRAVGLPSDG